MLMGWPTARISSRTFSIRSRPPACSSWSSVKPNEAGNVPVAAQAGVVGEIHGVGQKEGDAAAVGLFEEGAKAVAHGMGEGRVGVAKAQPGDAGRHPHLVAGFEVAAIHDGPFQVVEDQLHGLQAEPV